MQTKISLLGLFKKLNCLDDLIYITTPKIWNILPDEIKQQTSLNSFKKSVKKWKPQDCPCRLCKVYVNGVGFLS